MIHEKKVDTSLTAHMIVDGYKERYQAAALFTNDTDFVPVVDMVKNVVGKKVIFIPTVLDFERYVCRDLLKACSGHKLLSRDLIERSQLPDIVTTGKGTSITKPGDWK